MNLNLQEFCLDLIRDVSGVLEETVGLSEAEGYLAIVGQMMGERIYSGYGHTPETPLPETVLGDILVDLKQKIGGTFVIEEERADRITFVNGRCPFGDRVKDRKSLCMMTSNVFGFIASECKGYSKVQLEKTIAAGDGLCRVTVHFEKNDLPGREYYRVTDGDT